MHEEAIRPIQVLFDQGGCNAKSLIAQKFCRMVYRTFVVLYSKWKYKPTSTTSTNYYLVLFSLLIK